MHGGSAQRLRRAAARAIVGAIVLALGVPPFAPVQASEAPDAEVELPDVRPSTARLPITRSEFDGRHLHISNSLQRAYLLTSAVSPQTDGFGSLVSYDLRTGEEAGKAELDPPGYGDPYKHSGNDTGHVQGGKKVVAVDEEGGRLFVATQTPKVLSAPIDPARPARGLTSGNVCAQLGNPTSVSLCLNGVTVLDAHTMEFVRHIPLATLRVDGGPTGAALIAMSYSPPVGEMGGKVHMVVQDLAHAVGTVDGGSAAASGRNYYVPTYLVQFDPDAGRQDWAVRLDTCRGNRSGMSADYRYEVEGIEHQSAVFRSRQEADHAVYVACLMNSAALTVGVVRVPLSPEGNPIIGLQSAPEAPDVVLPDSAEDRPSDPSRSAGALGDAYGRAATVEGPDQVYEIYADPDSGRFVMQVLDGRPLAQVWWVYDTAVHQFVGTVGIGGPIEYGSSLSGFDAVNGRLYVLGTPLTMSGRTFPGGLFVADVRSTPVAQALAYAEFASRVPANFDLANKFRWDMSTQALPDGGVRVWYPDSQEVTKQTGMIAIDDHRLPAEAPPPLAFSGRTLDLEEQEGVTASAVDGAARGYGFRALLVGFAEAAARTGPVDPLGTAYQCNDPDMGEAKLASQTLSTVLHGSNHPRRNEGPCRMIDRPLPSECTQGNREIILASVGPEGPAVVDGSGARGSARPVTVDSLTATDARAPASRCSRSDWDQIWTTALFGRAPAEEPTTPDALNSLIAECVTSSEDDSDEIGDPVANGYRAEVACSEESASGYAYTRGVSIEGIRVGEALSSFRIYLDPGRGIVSRVESVARGVNIDGAARIDTVRGVAESWANGRAWTEPELAEGATYDANCDFERTAGTCFQRHLFGLRTPGYACGPCGDEQAFVQALNSAVNPNALVRLREPDARLRIGAENGFTAAIVKPEAERFADLVLNNDLLQTVLPTLEIIRYAPASRVFTRQGPRGRQIYQLAGVEVSSSYSIQCLLVYDEESNTCGAPAEAPGAITVSLQDGAGEPLAGGAFEVRQDVDADGVLGLVDTLLPDGACVTAEDGVGTCSFEDLQPGAYLVSQVAAPPGYAKSDEPFVVELASGEARTVAFTNVSNVSTIELAAQDENGGALEGAAFAAYPDPDADGKVAPDAQPAATCTTDASGACTMQVPAGSYVLVQTAAPGGLEGIEPVPFTFASGGQVAAVTITNYPPEVDGPPPAPSPEIVYTPPVDMPPAVEVLDGGGYVPTVDEPVTAPSGGVIETVGGTVVQVVRAPGDALRLLARDPKQAVAWTAAIALLCLAIMAVRRRQTIAALSQGV